MTPETARVLLHAYLDGELDAASTIELRARLKIPPPCAKSWRVYRPCRMPCKIVLPGTALRRHWQIVSSPVVL